MRSMYDYCCEFLLIYVPHISVIISDMAVDITLHDTKLSSSGYILATELGVITCILYYETWTCRMPL